MTIQRNGRNPLVELAFIIMAGIMGLATPVQADEPESVLDKVRQRGFLTCGTVGVTPGMAALDQNGRTVGFLADWCRALSAAVLGDAEAVRFRALEFPVWFSSVVDGEVDVLFASATRTLSREADLGVTFASPVYYDGQSFLKRAELPVTRLSEIKNDKPLSVCLLEKSNLELNVQDLIVRGVPLEIVPFKTGQGSFDGFISRQCDLITSDRLLLTMQVARTPNSEDFALLNDVISREPIAPAVRQGDDRWRKVVDWVVAGLMVAEVHGVTQKLAAQPEAVASGEARRLLGLEEDHGEQLGLSRGWGRRAVVAVGNYGEMFNRHLKPLGVDRGLNALWRDGGIYFPAPFR